MILPVFDMVGHGVPYIHAVPATSSSNLLHRGAQLCPHYWEHYQPNLVTKAYFGIGVAISIIHGHGILSAIESPEGPKNTAGEPLDDYQIFQECAILADDLEKIARTVRKAIVEDKIEADAIVPLYDPAIEPPLPDPTIEECIGQLEKLAISLSSHLARGER